jgi:peptidoglycan/LPS O-acetylase OafA/YrhL
VTNRRQDIQCLRGIAVVAVVLFHALDNWFPNGYLGVDVFFVVSGFVVTPLLVRIVEVDTAWSVLRRLGAFIARRIRRLVPALGVMLAGTALLMLFLAPVGARQAEAAKLGLAALIIRANVGAYRIAGNYFHHVPNPLIHTWSLSVEEQIYLLLPIVGAIAARGLRGRSPASILGVVLAIATVGSLATTLAPLVPIGAAVSESRDGAVWLFYATTSRIWEFGLGGLAVLIGRPPVTRWSSAVATAAVAALVILLFLPIGVSWPFPAPEALVAGLACVALVAAHGAEQWSRVTALAWLGDRSYSIYLWHMPMIVIALNSPAIGSRRGGAGLILGALFATVAAGDLSYRRIEQRFRDPALPDAPRVGLLRIVATFIAVPALALGMLGWAARNHFWGLNDHRPPLPLAWNIDSACQRLSAPSPSPCWYGTAKEPTALLVGDSHAASFSDTFVDAAEEVGLRAGVMTYAFCPLLLREAMPAGGPASAASILGPECARHNAAVLDLIGQRSPRVLVVSARSAEGYGLLFGGDGPAFFRAWTDASLERARHAVDQMVVIGPVAEFPDVNLGTTLFQQQRDIRPLAREHLPQAPFEDDRRLSILAARLNAIYLSTLSLMCDGPSCSYEHYVDETHLGLDAARVLKPMLARSLAGARTESSK